MFLPLQSELGINGNLIQLRRVFKCQGVMHIKSPKKHKDFMPHT